MANYDMNNPVQAVLAQISQFRSQVHQQLMKLPAPSPARQTLQSIDQQMAGLENQVRGGTIKGIPGFNQVTSKIAGFNTQIQNTLRMRR